MIEFLLSGNPCHTLRIKVDPKLVEAVYEIKDCSDVVCIQMVSGTVHDVLETFENVTNKIEILR